MSVRSVIKKIKEIKRKAKEDNNDAEQCIINTNRKLERQTNRVHEGNKLIKHLLLTLPPMNLFD